MKRLTFALLGALSLSACAQGSAPAATAAKPGAQAKPVAASVGTPYPAGSPEARAHVALQQLNSQIKIDRIGPAPLPGFREAIVGGQVVYVSDDGKYLMQGKLFDIAAKKDLGEATMNKVRGDLLKTIPLQDRIVFAPPNPKHTVVVFTDVECGYCRKLHSEMAEYNRQGIAVQYLAFPRMGLASEDFKKMVSVWCADDRRAALTAAKNDKPIAAKTCKSPVAMQYDLGQRMGLTGTPMIMASDGTQISGYMPPAQLRAALDKLAGEVAPAVKTASVGT